MDRVATAHIAAGHKIACNSQHIDSEVMPHHRRIKCIELTGGSGSAYSSGAVKEELLATLHTEMKSQLAASRRRQQITAAGLERVFSANREQEHRRVDEDVPHVPASFDMRSSVSARLSSAGPSPPAADATPRLVCASPN